jgi:two-component system cell cycle response regulator
MVDRDDVIDVLLVEDNPGDARLVREMLQQDDSTDFRLVHVELVRDAVERLNDPAQQIDAILLDLSLPDESGLDTVRRIVACSGRASVVVMTGAGDDDLGNAAVQEGAQDYLVKGSVDGRQLKRALRFAIRRNGMRLELQMQSNHDDLTGLYNRRGFMLLADQQLKLARRNRSACLLLFLDLDGLKTINDTYGHAEGNRAIVEAADVLRDVFRQSDVLARLGGDEFAGLAINASPDGEARLRDRLDEALERVNRRTDRPYQLDFSVGMLRCESETGVSLDELLARADRSMYAQKRQKKGTRPSQRLA